MKKVAIVGGGLAGLTCAFMLQRKGIANVVFESSAGAGGRCAAATYLLGREPYSNTFGLIESLGLSRAVIEIPPVAGQFYKGHVYRHRVSSATGLLRFKGLNIADKALLSRMAYLLVRYGSKLDFHRPEAGVDLDDESVATFVKRELSQNILNYVAGPLISTLFFYGSEETSKLLYLNLANYMHNTRISTLRGGLRALTHALAGKVRVDGETPVTRIVADGPGYLVNDRAFSHVVFALPGNAVLSIRGVKEMLSVEDVAFFEGCRYGRAVSISLETEEVLDRCYGVAVPRVEKSRVATVVHHGFFDPADRRVTIIGGGDDVSVEDLLKDARRIYPRIQAGQSGHEWPVAMPKFPPGRFREISGFLNRKRRSGLLFCGDYLMGPFVEAAVTTALKASEGV